MHDDDVIGKAYDSRLMRRLLGYLRPYRRSVLVALAAIITHSVLQLAPPYLTKLVIDTYIPAGDLGGLVHVAGIYLAVLAGSFALEFVQTWVMQLTGQRIMYDLRMELYAHLQRLDLRFYDRNPVGRLMTRVTSDVDVLNELFTAGVVAVFGDIFMLAGIMIVMLGMDWRLALASFLVLPLIAVITQWFRANVRESYRTVRAWIARINAFLQENITGMATVQLFRREGRNLTRFDEINAAHRDANIDSIFYYAVFYPAIELVGALAASIIIWVGGLNVLDGTLTLGVLVAFLQVLGPLLPPDQRHVREVQRPAIGHGIVGTHLHFARHSRGRHQPVDARPRSTGRSRGTSCSTTSGSPTRTRTGCCATCPSKFSPASGSGLVGATGSGKTTIISLLLRFYDIQRGRILVDGVDVRDLDLATLRGLFGLVLQDVHLFSGTLGGNIRLGHEDLDDLAVRRAAEAVDASDFIEELPGGYDAPVAERGATLSTGQKQLLSFARALAFNRRVLILDEATSSIDTETEMTIRQALEVLMQGRTTIVIAHRLSTIQDMDRILVLHKGAVRESGTHQALWRRGGSTTGSTSCSSSARRERTVVR